MRDDAARRTAETRHRGRVTARLARTRPHLYAADAAAVVVAGTLLSRVVPDVLGGVEPRSVALAAVAAAGLARLVGLHRPRLLPSVREDLPALVLVALTAALTTGLLTNAAWMTGRGWAWHAGLLAATVLVLGAGFRAAVYQLVLALRREGLVGQRVVIVDTGPEGTELAETLLARRELGLRPVGMISSVSGRPARGLPLPLLGGLADLHEAMDDLGVDDVVFALPDLGDAGTVAAVRRCVRDDGQVFVVPRTVPAVGTFTPADLVQVQRRDLRGFHLLRRAADLVASAVALVVLVPVLLPAVLALRLEVGRGVLFRQTRISDSGRPFTLLKLRTTRPTVFDADATSWHIDNDSTVGPVGRLFRATGVDELPQLLNVLRGEMRLAAPRTPRSELVRELSR